MWEVLPDPLMREDVLVSVFICLSRLGAMVTELLIDPHKQWHSVDSCLYNSPEQTEATVQRRWAASSVQAIFKGCGGTLQTFHRCGHTVPRCCLQLGGRRRRRGVPQRMQALGKARDCGRLADTRKCSACKRRARFSQPRSASGKRSLHAIQHVYFRRCSCLTLVSASQGLKY